jgi:hypothetical protein
MVRAGSSVKPRLKFLQARSRATLFIYHEQDADGEPAGLEALTHIILKKFALGHEWFNCNLSQSVKAINQAVNQLNTIDQKPPQTNSLAINHARTRMNQRRNDAVAEYRKLLE